MLINVRLAGTVSVTLIVTKVRQRGRKKMNGRKVKPEVKARVSNLIGQRAHPFIYLLILIHS